VPPLALAPLAVHAWRTFQVKPLDDYDAWAMWAMKGHALLEYGWADPKLFASNGATPLHLDYPLLVPALESIAFRAMGGFEPTLVHLQFLLVGAAGLAAILTLLRERVPPALLWTFAFAIAAAPSFLGQLLTAYADVPLALFVAAGVLAWGRWLESGDRANLALGTLLLAAAVLTKTEGIFFAAAALLGLTLAVRRRGLLLAAAAILATLLPWQIYTRVNGIHSDVFTASLANVHPGVAPIAVGQLATSMLDASHWTLLVPLFLLAVIGAGIRGDCRLAIFAWAWALFSLLALASVYVVSRVEFSNYLEFSRDRVVSSIALGAAALSPLLLTTIDPHARR